MKTCMVIIQCQRDKVLHCETFVGRRPGPESAGAHRSMQQHAAPLQLLFAALIPFTRSSALHGAFLWPLSAVYWPPG